MPSSPRKSETSEVTPTNSPVFAGRVPNWLGWAVAGILTVILLVVLLNRGPEETVEPVVVLQALPATLKQATYKFAEPDAALQYRVGAERAQSENRFRVDVDIEHFISDTRFNRYEFKTDLKLRSSGNEAQLDSSDGELVRVDVNQHVTTGVLVHPEGLILTTAGGLAAFENFEVLAHGSIPQVARVVVVDRAADLALLLIDTETRNKHVAIASEGSDPLSNLGENELKLAQIAGYPNAQLSARVGGHDWLNCNVSYSDEFAKYQLHTDVALSLVGAPVFSEQQELIGLLGTATFYGSDSPPVVDTVISRVTIRNFLLKHGVSFASATDSQQIAKSDLASTVLLLRARTEMDAQSVDHFDLAISGSYSEREKTVSGSMGRAGRTIEAEGTMGLAGTGFAKTVFKYTESSKVAPCLLPELSLSAIEALPRTKAKRWYRVQGISIRRKTISVFDKGGRKQGYSFEFSRIAPDGIPVTREKNPELFAAETERRKFKFDDLPAIEYSWYHVISETNDDIIVGRKSRVETVATSDAEKARLNMSGQIFFSKRLGRPRLGKFSGVFQFGVPGHPDLRQPVTVEYQYRDEAYVTRQENSRQQRTAEREQRASEIKAAVEAITVEKFDRYDPDK